MATTAKCVSVTQDESGLHYVFEGGEGKDFADAAEMQQYVTDALETADLSKPAFFAHILSIDENLSNPTLAQGIKIEIDLANLGTITNH